MLDRIEEYRQDWHAGPVRPRRRRSTLLRPQTREDWLAFLITLLLLGSALTLGWRYHREAGQWFDIQVRGTKTQLEMSSILHLLKQYYLANGSIPERPIEYIKPSLKPNKAFPPGCDFWGSTYMLASDPDGFWLRSAGPDRKPNTSDDLVRAVKYKEWARPN